MKGRTPVTRWSWCCTIRGSAAAYAHRVAILCAGHVAADGPLAEVFDERLLSQACDQAVEVLPHPRDGSLLVTPRRNL